MDDLRLGTLLRTIRIRRHLRQIDVARLAGVSPSTISRIERGHIGTFSFDVVRRVAAVLDVRIDVVPRWRGGDLDRLLNARHSRFHEVIARQFDEIGGWIRGPEVSFAIWGERGVIDILAYHAKRRMLLVIELKTDIADVNELVGIVDRKRRLAIQVATERGWAAKGADVSVWVVIADGSTNRRRIAAHRTMLRAAFPDDGRSIAGWLRDPRTPIRALSFWPNDGAEASSRLSIQRRVARRSETSIQRERPGEAAPTSGGAGKNPAMRDQLIRIGKRFVSDVQRDDVGGLAAELAYRFLFAIFPFGIFVAALTAFVATAIGIDDPTGKIIGALGDNLPKDLANGLRPQIEAVIGTARPSLLTIGAIAALWAATGGTNALIKGLNRAYEVEENRPFLPKTALAIGLTLLASVGIVVAFVTIVGASLLTSEVVRQLNLDQRMVDLVSLLRWPVVFVLLSVAVGVLYRLAPNVHVPFRWCLAGGAIFSVGWLTATALFGLYVANFANYSNTYGALGGVIVLMLWFYISAFILVAAAALVASALKETRPAVVEAARADKPRAETAAPPANATRPPALTTSIGRRQPRLRAKPAGWRSGPEDWAVAAGITAVGASIGAAIALVLGQSRTNGSGTG